MVAELVNKPSAVQKTAKPAPQRRLLLVDDSRLQRRLLSTMLRRWGYFVVEADSGQAAMTLCTQQVFDIVLSDWVMPGGMNGLEFCAAFRALPRDSYGYFILLTAKGGAGETALGLDAGADDFLTKPVSPDELHARLMAGERILAMEAELRAKNRLVTRTLAEIQGLYESLNRDLVEARKLQQSLVRERYRSFGASEVSLMLRPSGHVGGDLVGFFQINPTRLGVFALDVAGHGVASALMTARLAGLFSGNAPDQNVALLAGLDGQHAARAPAEVAAILNRLLLAEIETDSYFTLLYGDIDLETGQFSFVQAGHPHPVIQRASGVIEYVGTGGLPIGLFPEAQYETLTDRLQPGDRLLIMSDGVTECATPSGDELGENGLNALLVRNAGLRGPALLETLIWDLQAHAGGQDFQDDVSGVLFDFERPPVLA